MIDCENIKTPVEFITNLTLLTVSLATLVRTNIVANNKGLLDESENEIASIVNYETKRVAVHIQKLVDLVAERHGIDTEKVVNTLKKVDQKTPKNKKLKT